MKLLIKLALLLTFPVWFVPLIIFAMTKVLWNEISEAVEDAAFWKDFWKTFLRKV